MKLMAGQMQIWQMVGIPLILLVYQDSRNLQLMNLHPFGIFWNSDGVILIYHILIAIHPCFLQNTSILGLTYAQGGPRFG